MATDGRIEPGDPVFAGLDVELDGPIDVTGRLQSTAEGDIVWHARLSGLGHTTCRRCLADMVVPLAIEVHALFSADPDALDDPDVYPMAERATDVDLSAAVREEVALAMPAFCLCRDECAGLCPKCGTDLNVGACTCAASARPV